LEIIILLAEGNTEKTLYTKLLKRFLNIEKSSYDELPIPIKDLMGSFEKKYIDIFIVENKLLVLLLNCRGYERLRKYVKEILESEYLIDAIKNGLNNLIIVADMDKNPLNSMKGLFASIGFIPKIENYNLHINVNNHEIQIHIVEQGYQKEIEDDLEQLVRQVECKINKAISIFEEKLGMKLSPKQRLGIYEAVLVDNNGLPQLIDLIIDKTDDQEIEKKLEKEMKVIKIIKEILNHEKQA